MPDQPNPQNPEELIRLIMEQLIKDVENAEVLFIGPELPAPEEVLNIERYGFGRN